ncbi:DNA cytosine methyltransferase [Sinorhizobium meliloti]|uniref:DNA cytosine methyltransferase n=1 Tax=Rhizobium meliloti TaxID=382 RepID=UPI002380A736|nr:DNA cytosine methyltransferase [Sinorhizobium meliloti]MDE3796965.1 DNA cytosine methyltransferase [Sinorhizobium meliloti]
MNAVNHLFPEDQAIRVLDLFSAAAGGWSLGMHRAGYRTIAACEVIDWRRALYSENNPGVPVYDDVTTLTADRLIRDGVGLPDIIVGSPPCQDISSANTKGKGVDGERSGLYFEAVRIIDECRPRWFALENSANLRTRGADRVIDALAAIGYTCWPFVVSAGDIGANHERKRSWLVGFSIADADGDRRAARRQGWGSRVDISFQGDTRDAAQDGCGSRRTRGCVEPVERLSVETCGDARHANETIGTEVGGFSGWSNAYDCGGFETGDGADATEERPQGIAGHNEQRPDEEPEHADLLAGSEVGRSASPSPTPTEPWADWNGGLAHHLRVDDGLSGWVAQSRIAVGGPKGTVAASLIVEAFGDAVCPQIPEAIGRAILRVERALAAVANDNAALSKAA